MCLGSCIYPDSLYIVGISAADSVRDIKLGLGFFVGGKAIDDRIKVTVFQIDIETSKNQLMLKHDCQEDLRLK